MDIKVGESNYNVSAWEAAKFCTERQGGTIFGNFVKQVWGGLTNSEAYRTTKAKITKYANIQGFDVDEGKKALKFSSQQYHKVKDSRKHSKEYQAKIDLYLAKLETYNAEYVNKFQELSAQLDSYPTTIEGIKNPKKSQELKELYSEAGQLFSQFHSSMTIKFIKASSESSKLRESIKNFNKAVQSNADNVQELQQEVEKQFKEFYDVDGQVQSKYWGGLDAPKNTEEMLLRTKLQTLDMAIEAAKEAHEK